MFAREARILGTTILEIVRRYLRSYRGAYAHYHKVVEHLHTCIIWGRHLNQVDDTRWTTFAAWIGGAAKSRQRKDPWATHPMTEQMREEAMKRPPIESLLVQAQRAVTATTKPKARITPIESEALPALLEGDSASEGEASEAGSEADQLEPLSLSPLALE